MKTFVLAGLVAVAAALPQYSNPAASQSVHSSHSHHSKHHHSHTTAYGTAPSATPAATSANESTCTDEFDDEAPQTTAAAASNGTLPALTATGVTSADEPECTDEFDDEAPTTGAGASNGAFPTMTAGSSNGISFPSASGTGIIGGIPSSMPTSIIPSNSSTSSGNSTGGTAASNDFLRGINIGNWLILEKWMDDGSAFSGAFSGAHDQYSFDGTPGAAAALQKHWSSWFTKADVDQIKGYGFNALRIPIGYWAFDNSGSPYQTGAAQWLDQAIGWARDAGMKVLVDCHGSPGSQNGQDHSGHSGAIEWQQGDNLQKSTDVLVTMAKKYGAAEYKDVVWGIEMVNEPTANAPNSFSKSQDWASDAYGKMFAALENKDLRLITHDSFRGPQLFTNIAQKLVSASPQQKTFGVDQHDYQLYTDSDNALNQDQHVKNACGWADNLAKAKASMPTIVGEWSTLTNICAKSDGSTVPSSQGCGGDNGCSCTSSDPSQWKSALVTQVRKYVEAQLETYEKNSHGYFLWSWKGPGGWGVKGPADVGAFPKNVVTDRKFQGVCSGSN